MIVGGYTLHLYCDATEHTGYTRQSDLMVFGIEGDTSAYEVVRNEFAGINEHDTRTQAQQIGWRLIDRFAICPVCVRNGRRAPV